MKCFYHADADGRCSGFWVRSIKEIHDKYEPESIEMDYTKKFPFEKINKDEQVYIVDYSISPDEMLKLLTITEDITWIDHHKTAIEKYTDFPYKIRGIRYDGISGCMLTYCYVHHMTSRGEGEIKPFDISMTRNAPKFTKLINDWDVWKFDFGDDTRNFITAFNAYDFQPDSKLWDRFLCFPDDFVCADLIMYGSTMNDYRDGWAKEYCRTKGFETIIDGIKAFAINLGNCNSEYFKSVDNGDYDIFIPFSYNGEKWTYSLYSKTIDVSEIAKKYGGGGHKGAAGFSSTELLFKKVPEQC